MITINSVNLKASIVKGDSGIINVSNGTRGFLMGDTIYFTVKKVLDSEEDGNTVITKTIDTFNDDDTCTIEIDADDTKDLEVRWYYYDIVFKDKDGGVNTLIQDYTEPNFEIRLGVTNG